MPARLLELKKTPSRPGFVTRLARAISPSAQQALWPIVVFIPLCHEDRLEISAFAMNFFSSHF